MRRLPVVAFAALLLAPALASAEELHEARRGGIALGGSIGGGGMTIDNDTVGCPDCQYDPLAFEIDLHFGSMATPRTAVLFELQLNAKAVDDNPMFVESLGSLSAMLAVQYWLTAPIWIKGGYGFATTSVTKEEGNIRQHGPGAQGFAF